MVGQTLRIQPSTHGRHHLGVRVAGARIERDRFRYECGETGEINDALHLSSKSQRAGGGQDRMGETNTGDLNG